MAGRVLLSTTEPDAAGVRELVGVAVAVPQEVTSSLPTSSQTASLTEAVAGEMGEELAGALVALHTASAQGLATLSHFLCGLPRCRQLQLCPPRYSAVACTHEHEVACTMSPACLTACWLYGAHRRCERQRLEREHGVRRCRSPPRWLALHVLHLGERRHLHCGVRGLSQTEATAIVP